MTRLIISTLAAGLILLPGSAIAGERVKADIDCAPTAEDLVYDCTIMLTGKNSGGPIEGADVTVNADMPSMPMTHNVRPVKAMPMGGPGGYHAQIELEMYGQWAITLDVEGPTRDRVIEKLQFGDVKADAAEMHGEHDHGSMADDEMKHDAMGNHEMKHGNDAGDGDHGDMKGMERTE